MDEDEVRRGQVQVDRHLLRAEDGCASQGIPGVPQEEAGGTEGRPRRGSQEVNGSPALYSAEFGDGFLDGPELLDERNGRVLRIVEFLGLLENSGCLSFRYGYDAIFVSGDD